MLIEKISINNCQEIVIKKLTIKGQTFVRLILKICRQGISLPTNISFDFNLQSLDKLMQGLTMIEYLENPIKAFA